MKVFAGAALFAIAASASAQQLPPPGAGDVLRDLGDKAKAIPPAKAPPPIEVAPDARRAVKPLPGFRIDVSGFRFSGLTPAPDKTVDAVLQQFVGLPAIPEARLQALVRPYVGPGKTFEDLQAAADAVTKYLRSRGYFVAQAFIPEQKLAAGVVEIAILEGRLGEVRVDMDARAPVRREQVERLLSSLTPGIVLHEDTIERALLIASDLRGITLRSVIEPGAQPGTATLVVKVEAARRVDGTIEFDNHGSRFTGELRAGASVNWNSPLGRGDLLSFRGGVAVPGGGKDTEFGRVSYLAPIGRYGTKVGAAYLKLKYHLGTTTFEPLDQSGESTVVSAFVLHPLVRVRAVNVIAQASYDVREFSDNRVAVGTISDRKIKAGAFSLLGDWRDGFLGGGLNNFSLAVTRGELELQSPPDLAADQGPNGRSADGAYSKLNGSVVRIHNLAPATSVYLTYSFQRAWDNLDGSEKLSLGGPNAVRAYAVGEATSDDAQLFTAELRHGLRRMGPVPGHVIGSVFYDYGVGRLSHRPNPGEFNRRTLQGAGLGATWLLQDNFFVRASLAWRLSGSATSDPADRKPRLFFQLVKHL